MLQSMTLNRSRFTEVSQQALSSLLVQSILVIAAHLFIDSPLKPGLSLCPIVCVVHVLFCIFPAFRVSLVDFPSTPGVFSPPLGLSALSLIVPTSVH